MRFRSKKSKVTESQLHTYSTPVRCDDPITLAVNDSTHPHSTPFRLYEDTSSFHSHGRSSTNPRQQHPVKPENTKNAKPAVSFYLYGETSAADHFIRGRPPRIIGGAAGKRGQGKGNMVSCTHVVVCILE